MTGSRSRPAIGRRRASTSPGCARCRACPTRSAGLGTFDVTDGADEPAVVASAVEFLLEGLHLARRLNKDRVAGGDDLPPVTAVAPDRATSGGPSLARPGRRGSRPTPCARRARAIRAGTASQRLPDLDADEILEALSDDVMAEGDLAEALRRLMERGWRSGDPTRAGPGRPAGPHGSPGAPTRGAPRALPAGRRPGRHPARARGDRRPRNGPASSDGSTRRPATGPTADPDLERHAPRRGRASGSTGSTRCPPTSASGSATCASTTSSSPTPASASTRSSSGSASRSSTSSCRAWATPSGR